MMIRLMTFLAVALLSVNAMKALAVVQTPVGWTSQNLRDMINACEAPDTDRLIANYCSSRSCSSFLRDQMATVCRQHEAEDLDLPATQPTPFRVLPHSLYVIGDSTVDNTWESKTSKGNWVDLAEQAGVNAHHLAMNGQTAKNAANTGMTKVLRFLTTNGYGYPVTGKHAVVISLMANDSALYGDLTGFMQDYRSLLSQIEHEMRNVNSETYCLMPFAAQRYGQYSDANGDGSTIIDHVQALISFSEEGLCTLINTLNWDMPDDSWALDGHHLTPAGHRNAFRHLFGR